MPQIQWPHSFETALSSNDPGLNITEKIYFVSQSTTQRTININLLMCVGPKTQKAKNSDLLLHSRT